jgi:membrane glycosyltransferase
MAIRHSIRAALFALVALAASAAIAGFVVSATHAKPTAGGKGPQSSPVSVSRTTVLAGVMQPDPILILDR